MFRTRAKLNSIGFRFSSSSPLSSGYAVSPVVELREYLLNPKDTNLYLNVAADFSYLRNEIEPLRLFATPETGLIVNKAIHLYYYEGGLEERDRKKIFQGKSSQWQDYLRQARPCMQEQRSSIYVEAPLVYSDSRISGFKTEFLANESNDKMSSLYEIRRYQLRLGYDTVPKFLSFYSSGLPSKLNATGSDPTTSLCSVLYNEVGSLNEVIEIWRVRAKEICLAAVFIHTNTLLYKPKMLVLKLFSFCSVINASQHGGGLAAMAKSREAARSALPWREAIGNIATLANSFSNTLVKPTSFSNWK